eukprot:TRINITY_DN490_c0_g1_i1.p1 TRINITY_DN490_c0_g1~~TRINITY_DN490_c0_g1_i1.p1  ORF type:complete len:835 (+),score=137.67 TRINITY_DN490_c0_g1_i1:141-2645(+)
MGELFRSQDMTLIQLFFQVEAAHDTFDELGQVGLVQFRDLNPDVNLFQRHFVNELKRADEMERKLRFFEDQVCDSPIADEFDDNGPGADLARMYALESTSVQEIGELETQFEDIEKELLTMNGNQETLKRNYNELIELQEVLTKDEEFFESSGDKADEEDSLWGEGESPEGGINFQQVVKLGFVSGVIQTDKMQTFERVLWRATRGNLYMKHTAIDKPIEDPHTNEKQEKSVFIIFYQGNRAQDKIKKICESFSANLYPCPESSQDRRELLEQVRQRLSDLQIVLQRSIDHRYRLLHSIYPNLPKWKAKVAKDKAIYHTMNMCNYDVGRKCLIAEGWCPTTAIDSVSNALKRADERSEALIPSILNTIKAKEEPPTYFKTNKFTQSFQGIVDAYGMARYGEVNPGVYTIITFPFLFGVMFGDVGHGFLMFLFALFLIIKEKSLGKHNLNEMIFTCFNGRYLLLLMAICSIYCGFIYNECFAVPLDMFGSRWLYKDGSLQATWTNPSIAYPFGVDPAWKGAENELTFYNSLKMKLSVIFGVLQMCFGIALSLINALHFRKPYNIWFEFLPQMAFMCATFGYMCFLIFLKWCIDWPNNGKSAPYLLNLMINMFLKPFKLQDGEDLYPGQLYVQWFLILTAFISVPMMLLPKPLLLRRDHKKKMRARGHVVARKDKGEGEEERLIDSEAPVQPLPHAGEEDEEEEEEEFEFGEVMIHQVIHTIEFVLGAISNTASYLRLWALSLAHSELATVFWERVLAQTFVMASSYYFIVPFGGFAVWAAFTFGVLLVMEALSAFLHALRLHWVEFQNKFYSGDGYPFAPFSYNIILSSDEEGSL